MVDLATVLADLHDESVELESMVAALSEQQWRCPTPAEGWTIADQIAHLTWTDKASEVAVTDPTGFAVAYLEPLEVSLAAGRDPIDEAARELGDRPTADLLADWKAGRRALGKQLRLRSPAEGKIIWFGPPMSPATMATARLMETWAHGQDIADALGVTRAPTRRLRHLAHLGYRTRDFAFAANGMAAPTVPFFVEVTGPEGQVWQFGDRDAPQRVTGSAEAFALVVTQRRHPDDVDLYADGPDAKRWLAIAQAFAGPPGEGRQPGQFDEPAERAGQR